MSKLHCPHCFQKLPVTDIGSLESSFCPHCHKAVNWIAFPVIHYQDNKDNISQNILNEEEANCFYHHNRKAVLTCDQCGRFICSMCDIALHNKHLCPNCYNSSIRKKKDKDLEKSRVLYDDLALALAIWPIFTFYFTIFTSFISIYFAVRFWNVNTSIIPRSNSKKTIAIILSLLEIIFWIFFLGYLISFFKAGAQSQ